MMHQNNHRKPIMATLIATVMLFCTAMFQNCGSNKSTLQPQSGSVTLSSTGVNPGDDQLTPHVQIIIVTLSTTRDGIAQNIFSVNQVVHGKVTGVGSTNIASCVEIVGTGSVCTNDKFTNMPANGWTFDGHAWRTTMTMTPDFANKNFRLFWLDKATGKKSPPAEFKVVPASAPALSCNWEGGGAVVGPCSSQSTQCTQAKVNSQSSIQCGNGPVTQVCVCK